MYPVNKFHVIYLLLLYVITGQCNPFAKRCSLGKCPSNYIFKPGHIYMYNYTVQITTMKGNHDRYLDEDRISFRSEVEIVADNQCNLYLSIVSPQFYDEKNVSCDTYTQGFLQEKSMIFRYNQGKVISGCTSNTDPKTDINMKLGVLSILQYTHQNFSDYNVTETNINGVCQNQYTRSELDGWIILRRNTDLNKCDLRTIEERSFFNLYNNVNVTRSDQIVKSQQKCRHVIKETGEPIMALCRENHTVHPFKNFEETRITIRQQLDLDRIVVKTHHNMETNMSTYSSHRYHYVYNFDDDNSYDFPLERLLLLIRTKHKSDDKKFLHRILESMEPNDILNVYDRSKTEEKRFFLSLIEDVLTEKVLKFILNLYNSNQMNEEQLRRYLNRIPYVELPTLDMMKIVQIWINNDTYRSLALFSQSGLIRNFCKKYPTCAEFQDIMDIFEEVEYVGDINDQEAVLTWLSFVENAGISYSINSIISIYHNKTQPKILRLAAIRSHRHMSCKNRLKQLVFQVFADQDDDVSVRIEAFLTLVRCPSLEVLKLISFVLLEEHANQVTLFVWNYLKNMRTEEPEYTELIEQALNFEQIKWKYEPADESNSISLDSDLFSLYWNESGKIITVGDGMSAGSEFFKASSTIRLFDTMVSLFDFEGYTKRSRPVSKSDYQTKSLLCNDDYVDNVDIFQQKDVNDDVTTTDEESTKRYVYLSVGENVLYTLNTSELQSQLKRAFEDFNIKSISRPNLKFKNRIKLLDTSYLTPTVTGFPLFIEVEVNSSVMFKTSINTSRSKWAVCDFNLYLDVSLVTITVADVKISLDSYCRVVKIHNQIIERNQVL